MTQTAQDYTIDQKEALYDRYRSKIEHEDNLINQRIMWMITLHGLLFTAFGFSLSAEATSLSYINTAPAAYKLFKSNLTDLRNAMIWIGMGSSVTAFIGVVAAFRAIRDDETEIRNLDNSGTAILRNPIGKRTTNILGMLSGLLVPILGLLVWISIGRYIPDAMLILTGLISTLVLLLMGWALM
ncbi:MAG: hypothetical protein ACK587_08730 [Cyanobacteriota bacterium]